MRNYCFLLLFCGLSAATLHGQLSVHLTGQRYDNQIIHPAYAKNQPFVSFYQVGAGAAWQRRAFNVYASVSFLAKKESLHETTEYTSWGSFGSSSTMYTSTYSADAAVSYVGFRLGVDYVVSRRSKFNLLLGAVVHLDGLISERESNHYRTSDYTGGPPATAPFDAIDARKTYLYYGIRVRPRYYFRKNFYAELQLGVNTYSNQRILNNVYSRSDSYSYPYYASRWNHQFISNELGVGVGYVFGKKKKLPESPPGGAW